MAKAIVLVSGGIDSTVALWWAREKRLETVPLSVNYFARPEAEKLAMRRILRRAGISGLIEVPLEFLKEAEDLNLEGKLPRRLRNSPEGYVPARNAIFYSIAAYYSEILDARYVVGGHIETDPQEFPDSGPRFIEGLNNLLRLGIWSFGKGRIEIITPLRHKTKKEVVRLGLRLGAPIEQTWSCHYDGKKPCGRCSSCVERSEAFGSLGVGKDRSKK